MSEIFISYASDDRERARAVATALESEGWSVWWDRHIPPGKDFDTVIEQAIEGARCVLVLWTESSVASRWVRTEAAEGLRRGVLVPAMLEEIEIPLEFRRIQAANLIGWHGERDTPGWMNLQHAVASTLASSHDSSIEIEPDSSPTSTASSSTGQTPRTKVPEPAPVIGRNLLAYLREHWKWVGAGVAVIATAALAVTVMSSNEPPPPVDYETAVGELNGLLADTTWATEPTNRRGQIPVPQGRFGTLPSIDEFPIVVDAPLLSGTVVEIFVSTEKAGEGTDGWLVEVAEAFNDADQRLSNGDRARVRIRRIPSGTAYEFIASGRYEPDAYTPSNRLWIEMASEWTTLTPVREQLVPNVAGIVLEQAKADELRASYGTLDAGAIIDAVVAEDLTMAYTDPYASSTGLNFLVTVLAEFADALGEPDLTASRVEAAFEDFQGKVPFVAPTTLQIRDSVEQGGSLEAFVMEYQTFSQAATLSSGFEFIPFGIRHDNPLYAVGRPSDSKLEALELFAAFAEQAEYRNLATEYGFDPPAYSEPLEAPDGDVLIASQEVWKTNKDGGEPVTAVFVADVSGSMEGTRIGALADALKSSIEFIDSRNSVGMVVFNSSTTVTVEVGEFDTTQQQRFAGALDDLEAAGGTAMYDGVAVGLKLLTDRLAAQEAAGETGRARLIVLTDGEANSGHSFDDVKRIIEGLGIQIYSIGFEADVDELCPMSELVEAACFNASEDNVRRLITSLFNLTA